MLAQVAEGRTALAGFSMTVGIGCVGGLGGSDFGGGRFVHGGGCLGGNGASFGGGWWSFGGSHQWTIAVRPNHISQR